MNDDTFFPFEYLASCSKPALESFELARLNRAANFRKEFRDILEEWIQAESEARLARWLLEDKRRQSSDVRVSQEETKQPQLAGTPVPNSLLSAPDGRAACLMSQILTSQILTSQILTSHLDEPVLADVLTAGGEERRSRGVALEAVRPEEERVSASKHAVRCARKAANPAQLQLNEAWIANADGTPSLDAPVLPQTSAESIARVDRAATDTNGATTSCRERLECPSYHLHPAIQSKPDRGSGNNDALGEASPAPQTEVTTSCNGIEKNKMQISPGKKTEPSVRFRIYFGVQRRRRDEIAAAS